QAQRLAARHVLDDLHSVAELERVEELTVPGSEVADEAHRHILQARRLERTQERFRVAVAEERAGVRESKTICAPVLEPGEVVEVRTVRDRDHLRTRIEAASLLRDRVRGG